MTLETFQIAATPLEPSPLLLPVDSYIDSKPYLRKAMDLYKERYLPQELGGRDGIPGEGENVEDIISRLRGDDKHVKRVTVIGLKDSDGQLQGVTFVETYIVAPEPSQSEPEPKPGLVHLCTYSAVTDNYTNDREATSKLHLAMMETLRQVDRELGFEGNSVYKAEVNCPRDFNNTYLISKMNPDPEFEIKSGAHREERAAYDIEHLPDEAGFIPLHGNNGYKSYALNYGNKIVYPPPNLDAADVTDPHALIGNAEALAAHAENLDIKERRGDPLYFVCRGLGIDDNDPPTPRQIRLAKMGVRKLYASVLEGNMGISEEHSTPALNIMPSLIALNGGYDALEVLSTKTPSTIIDPRNASAVDVQRAMSQYRQ